jgi:hypothetical protein
MNEKLEKTPSLEVASPYLLSNEKQVMQGDEQKKKPERTPKPRRDLSIPTFFPPWVISLCNWAI